MKTFAAATIAATLCASTAQAVTVELIATLRPGDPAGIFFGVDVAVDGNRALIAGEFETGAPGGGAAVSLYDFSGPVPVRTVITPEPGAPEGVFGVRVALDGDRALIGTLRSGTGEPDFVTVYDLSGPTPTPVRTLTASDGRSGDQFGRSLALDGDRAVVGADFAPGRDPADARQEGAVYLFDLSDPSPNETAKLLPFDVLQPDQFGFDVAIEGDTLIASGDGVLKTSPGFDGGAAYRYDLGDAPPTEVEVLRGDESVNDDFDGFGAALDLEDGIALIGAFEEDSGPDGREGAAYLIDTRLDPGEAGRRQRLVADDLGPAAFFGEAVALDDGLALIGAPSFDGPGAAYVFDALTGRQLARIDAPNSAEEQDFGFEVALSGNLALISILGRVLPSRDRAPRTVYVYRIEQPARIPLPAPALLLVGAMGALALAARRA